MAGLVLPISRLGLRPPEGSKERSTPGESVTEELNPFHTDYPLAASLGITTVGLLPGPGAPGGEGIAVRPAEAGAAGFVLEKGRSLRLDVETSTNWSKSVASTFEKAKKEVQQEDAHEDAVAKWRIEKAAWDERKAAFERAAKDAKEKPAGGEAKDPKVPEEPPKDGAKKEEPKKAEGPADPGKAPDEPKPPKLDPKNAVVRDAVRRRVPVVVISGNANDADRALDALAGLRLRLVFWAGGDTWRAAPRIAGADAPVIVRVELDTEPGSQDRVNPAAVFDAAGCPVAFALLSEGRTGMENLRTQVARLVHDGLPRAAAMRALGRAAAELLGLESEVGTVAPGRRADLVLLDGDPLEPATRLRAVWSGGVPVEAPGERP